MKPFTHLFVVLSLFAPVCSQPVPINPADINAMKVLLFGGAAFLNVPNFDDWYKHGINFDESLDSNFHLGLAQPYAGPCGILAVLQCLLLIPIVYGFNLFAPPINHDIKAVQRNGCGRDFPRLAAITEIVKRNALAQAMAYVIRLAAQADCWRRGELPNGAFRLVTLSSDFPLSHFGAWNNLQEETFNDFDGLVQGITNHIGQFQSLNGILLFTFSVIRSRRIEVVKRDADSFIQDPLITEDSNMTQSFLNLFLTGRGVGGVFNGVRGDDDTRIHGTIQQSLIGLVYRLPIGQQFRGNAVVVGGNLSNPSFPLFVFGNNYHYYCGCEFDPTDTVPVKNAEMLQLLTLQGMQDSLSNAFNRHCSPRDELLHTGQAIPFMAMFFANVQYVLNDEAIEYFKRSDRNRTYVNVFFKEFIENAVNAVVAQQAVAQQIVAQQVPDFVRKLVLIDGMGAYRLRHLILRQGPAPINPSVFLRLIWTKWPNTVMRILAHRIGMIV
jgi:hypothetical protein